ncbi:hypothetical protein D3C72_275790 [compost metagenome]
MNVTFTGFRELEDALEDFSKASARNIMKRAALEAIQPLADEMANLAPERANGGGNLKDAIAVSDKLGKRQKRLQRRQTNDFVEVYAGVEDVGGVHVPSSVQQEFGNENHGPQPYARPAYDKEAQPTVDRLLITLKDEIDKATARAQRRAARAAARAARPVATPIRTVP